MKRVLCIFAHPDDESFGPGGTIHLLTKTHDVYMICVTNGDAGKNSLLNTSLSLGEIRKKELQKSSQFLGTKKVYFLNYPDGSLNNLTYHEIAEKIKAIADELQPEIFLTFEPHGISGHLDHIAVSMITTYVFNSSPYVKKLMYYCMSKEQGDAFGDYFVYRPDGYRKNEIDEIVDISTVREHKTKSMQFHKSQLHDLKRMIDLFGSHTEEYFLVKKRD